MRFLSRIFLLAAVGTVSLVLAGCYGTTASFRNVDRDYYPPRLGQDEAPVPDLETAPGPRPKQGTREQ